MRRTLNEVIAKDNKERERSIKDRFDSELIGKLISACEQGTGDPKEATCILRRFLTLTHGLTIDEIDALFESAALFALTAKEMSA